MNNPKISVCIPTYNNARFLSDAIDSILMQTFSDFELIIIDNCSNDHTAELVKKYCSKDDRIKFSVNDSNIGMSNNFNKCLESASGDYIKFLCSDDKLTTPDALMLMSDLLDRDSDLVMAVSAREITDANGVPIKVLSLFDARTTYHGKDVIARCFLFDNQIGEPSAVMFRRNMAKRGFNNNYSQLVDLEMWFHLLEQGSLRYIAEPLTSIRVHAGQQTKENLKNLVYIDDYFMLMSDYLDKEYIRFSPIEKKLIFLDKCYALWKYYKNDIITKKMAIEKIEEHYPFKLFKLFLPIYKIAKPAWKLRQRAVRNV